MEDNKQAVRAAVRERLRALTEDQRRESDRLLFQRFLSLPVTEQAGTIFAFWGIAGREPDTSRLIAALLERGKRICLPRMLPEHRMEVREYRPHRPLAEAGYGILEPDPGCPLVERDKIDLVLVPALCYDRRGYRLGFGGGYYDRWLAGYGGMTAGLCREAVLLDRVPIQAHDSRVQYLVTERESLSCSGEKTEAERTSPPPCSV